jgi:hypothetical protein
MFLLLQDNPLLLLLLLVGRGPGSVLLPVLAWLRLAVLLLLLPPPGLLSKLVEESAGQQRKGGEHRTRMQHTAAQDRHDVISPGLGHTSSSCFSNTPAAPAGAPLDAVMVLLVLLLSHSL